MDNSEQVDPNFLKNEAYRDAGDLKTRIQIQEEYSTNPQDWFRWVFDRFDLPAMTRILELGCGPGDLWQKNQDRLPEGWSVILSDFSLGMMDDLRKSPILQDPRFQFCALDAQAIPFPSGTYDAVVGNGLIDHLPNPRPALIEIRRVLKPGGKFYTTTGGRNHLLEFEELIRIFLPEKDFGGDPDRFGLENGEWVLSNWFSNIRREDYRSHLVFEREEPILEYIFSEGGVRAETSGETLARFKAFLKEQFAERGMIRVTVEKGLFEAVRR